MTLKGFLLLGGFLALDGLTSTFQEKLFKDRPLFATASTWCFFKQAALTSNLFTLGVYCFILDSLPMLFFWTCKPYPKLVSTAPLGFLGASLKEHQTTKYNQMMYINLLCFGLERVSNDSRSSCWRSKIGAQCLHCSLTLMFVLDFTSEDIT